MKRLISLYPKSWRDRYENEFAALLDDVPPTWGTLFDVLGGALKMQMKIWSPWKIVAAFGIAGVLIAAGSSLMIPNRYISTAIVKTHGDRADLPAILHRAESRAFLTTLINEQDLYRAERAHIPLEDVIEQMKSKDIRISGVRALGDNAFAVSFSSPDPAKAQRTAQRLASQFVDANVGEFLDPASLPINPTSPKRSWIVVSGLVGGMLLGGLLALFNGLKLWKLAGGLGLAGALLAGVASYLVRDHFVSSAVLLYRATDEPLVHQAVQKVTSGANFHELVQRFGLYPNEVGADRRLSEHLHIQDLQKSRAITIGFEYPDQRVAHQVTQRVVAQFIEQNWNFEILDPASFPQSPVFPNRAAATGTGLFVGLACATILGAFKAHRRSRVLGV